MAVVELRGVSKSYGSVEALRDVSLEIGAGVTGLLGPNGAGKSTLLLCVLGLLPDWTGEAEVAGLDARRKSREVRRRTGFMPELDAYIPDMTAIRAVRFLGRLSGMPRSQALRRAHEVLWHVGLGEAIYRDVREYSTGMRQRFKLAQALVHDPEILFLDEPLAGMDPSGRDELLDLVRDLANNHGKHIVWSSHILPEVQKVADAVVILQEGRSVGSFRLEDLSPQETHYALEVEGDPVEYLRLLESAGIAWDDAANGRGVSSGGLGRRTLTVRLPADRSVHDLMRLGRLGAVRVRRVAPVKEGLEDVFHRLVREGEATP